MENHTLKLFREVYSDGGQIHGAALSGIEFACWDIMGKAAGLPLYRLFGSYRDQVPCYVTCAYYREGKDLAELRDEIERLKAQGG